jgi:hypothetical protein
MLKRKKLIQEALTLIKGEGLAKYVSSSSDEPFKLPFELLPKDFLQYAEADLVNKGKHAAVNSIGNIKRAIDCRVDSLLVLFAMYGIAKRENWNFPRKVKFLKEIGVLAPRILERINTKRNKLEHEYRLLSHTETEDAFDIASLFIDSTNVFLMRSFSDFEWESVYPDESTSWVRIELKQKSDCFKIEYIKQRQLAVRFKISNTDQEEFFPLLKEWILAVRRGVT